MGYEKISHHTSLRQAYKKDRGQEYQLIFLIFQRAEALKYSTKLLKFSQP